MRVIIHINQLAGSIVCVLLHVADSTLSSRFLISLWWGAVRRWRNSGTSPEWPRTPRKSSSETTTACCSLLRHHRGNVHQITRLFHVSGPILSYRVIWGLVWSLHFYNKRTSRTRPTSWTSPGAWLLRHQEKVLPSRLSGVRACRTLGEQHFRCSFIAAWN